MKYIEINILDKIDRLQTAFIYATKLAEALNISRRTLLNWRQKPHSISAKSYLDIDVLYCQHFLIPEWDNPKQQFDTVLLPDAMSHNEAMFLPFLRRLSYGTIEIETDISKADFDSIIDGKRLPKNMNKQTFHEGFNTFITHKQLWQKIVGHGEQFPITVENIKNLHADFMRGFYDNAGFFSTKMRLMGQLENIQTTHPEDIDEEMHRWVYKEAKAVSLAAIAKAHAYFILIHPFGDGNGRVGRALVMAQCLNARLMPPVFDGSNRAMYYAAMQHAMQHGRYAPLVKLFYEATQQ